MTFDELLAKIGNKSVYDESELQTRYNNDKNMFVVEMLYYGYFGEGHNINMDTLETKGYWSNSHGGTYPALIRLTPRRIQRNTTGGQRRCRQCYYRLNLNMPK